MLPTYDQLREMLRLVILNKEEQGHVVDGLVEELVEQPDAYDFLHAFARRLARLPLRDDGRTSSPTTSRGSGRSATRRAPSARSPASTSRTPPVAPRRGSSAAPAAASWASPWR